MHRSLRAAPRHARRTAIALLAFAAPGAFADPADFVFVPYASAGQRVVAWASGVSRDRDGGRASGQVLTLGWSPTARWFTSAYGAWAADDGAHYVVDEWTWLNHVQLTAPGAGPLALGALLEVEHEHERGAGTGLAVGPTLELDTDTLQWNLDIEIDKRVGAIESAPAGLGYQWQVKGLFARHVELGAQGFGDVGPWNHWASASQQSHQVGPAIFAKWTQGGGRELRADAAWLAGLGGGPPRDTLRLRVQQVF